MQPTIEFLIKITAFWGLSLFWYQYFLRQQRLLASNRAFLLLTVLLGPLLFCLPAWWQVEEKVYAYNLAGIAVSAGSEAIAEQTAAQWPLWLTLLLVGIGISLARLLASIWLLRRLLRKAQPQTWEGQRLLRTAQSADCYTFFGYIVVSDQVPDSDLPCIVAHESAHRSLGHSRDILLLELLAVLFWFHPFIYLYRFLLRELHEYQADAAVRQHFPLRYYADLLLQRAMNTRVSLLHNFSNHSQLKNRIMMMTSKKSSQTWKYWLAMPLMLTLLFAFQVQTLKAQVEDAPDEMPLYGKCTSSNADELQACSMKNLISALVSQIKYPEAAKTAKKEGKVFVEFVVSKNGKVKDAKVLRSMDADCDAEALRVVKSLNQWQAGKKDGKKVDVKMVLPIAFKLS